MAIQWQSSNILTFSGLAWLFSYLWNSSGRIFSECFWIHGRGFVSLEMGFYRPIDCEWDEDFFHQKWASVCHFLNKVNHINWLIDSFFFFLNLIFIHRLCSLVYCKIVYFYSNEESSGETDNKFPFLPSFLQ